MLKLNTRRIRELLHLNIWQDPRKVTTLRLMTEKIEELEARIEEFETDGR